MASSNQRDRQRGRGLFVTFEGGEGSGKSSQILRLSEELKNRRLPVLVTREPGGSPGAEALRQVLLAGDARALGASGEAMLFAAARMDHVETVIAPALAAGKIVLCDRFFDSTWAYQGASGAANPSLLRALDSLSIGSVTPDRTILLDIDPSIGLERARLREEERGQGADRFEKDDLALHRARRDAFLSRAASEPQRFVVVDAALPAGSVYRRIVAALEPLLASAEEA